MNPDLPPPPSFGRRPASATRKTTHQHSDRTSKLFLLASIEGDIKYHLRQLRRENLSVANRRKHLAAIEALKLSRKEAQANREEEVDKDDDPAVAWTSASTGVEGSSELAEDLDYRPTVGGLRRGAYADRYPSPS